jgi:hypothetical protein
VCSVPTPTSHSQCDYIEMDPPMSDWFRSIPYAYDSMANTVKVKRSMHVCYWLTNCCKQFQQETMASLIRYYKRKCVDSRELIIRLKAEAAENKILKKWCFLISRKTNIDVPTERSRDSSSRTPNFVNTSITSLSTWWMGHHHKPTPMENARGASSPFLHDTHTSTAFCKHSVMERVQAHPLSQHLLVLIDSHFL